MSEVPRVSWVLWSRSLEGLTPTQSLVVGELARLADWRGEAVCPVSHLVDCTQRTRRAVHNALRGLEARGLVDCRQRWRPDGSQASSWRRLVSLAAVADFEAVKAVDEAAKQGVEPVDDLTDPDGPVIGCTDDEGLRAAICQAIEEAWVGPSARLIARSMLVVVGRQFKTTVERGVDFAFMPIEESRWDTASWAWETLRCGAAVIVQARSPWAMWSNNTLRASAERNWPVPEGVRVEDLEASGPLAVGDGLGVGDAAGMEAVSLDDFEGVLEGAVEALIAAGMSEALAWAGMLRVVELSLRGASRRHQAAAEDPRLADLGVSPRCARAWMTLLVGSRRGAAASLLDLDAAQLAERAGALVEVYREDLAAAR